MRVPSANGGLSCLAIAGTRVVMVALDMAASDAAGLLGFSFQRGLKGQAKSYLQGKKAFPVHLKTGDPSATYSTETDPVQSFLWSDERAEPDTEYDYTITALFGSPGALRKGAAVTFSIRTEKEDDGRTAIYFNRGAIASQAFAHRFNNALLTDAEADDPANQKTEWLSRGLLEGFLAYVRNTRAGEGLRVVAYEFEYGPVLRELKAAHDRGVSLEIVHDEKQGARMEQAVKAAKLDSIHPPVLLPRHKTVGIAHNKFVVRLDSSGTPAAVWTGSTNFTSSGFLGQTNAGHVIHDAKVAGQYHDYFLALKKQPGKPASITAATGLSPDPAPLPRDKITTVFSPRGADPMIDWYGQKIADAANSAMITCPFTVDQRISDPMSDARKAANYFLLLEKPPERSVLAAKKKNPSGLNISHGAVLGQRRMAGKNADGRPMTKTAPIPNFALDQWFLKEELARRSNEGFVFFVHAKFLLVDPLSSDPLLCTGSANFSSNSQKNNDENMLLIRGDTRAADIYMTEFDRIFRHFYFRDIANWQAAGGTDANARKAAELSETDAWTAEYFTAGHPKARRRQMFFAPSSPNWTTSAQADADVFATTPQPRKRAAAKKATPRTSPTKTARKSVKKVPAKKAAAKKPAAKKPAAKKAAAKRSVAKKPAARKAAAKKRPARKAAGRRR